MHSCKVTHISILAHTWLGAGRSAMCSDQDNGQSVFQEDSKKLNISGTAHQAQTIDVVKIPACGQLHVPK